MPNLSMHYHSFIPKVLSAVLLAHLLVLLLLLQLLQCVSGADHFRPRYGAPRFKQNVRSHQFAYLGDTIRFKCNAIGRPQPKVHWYRGDQYLNYSYLSAHPRLKERGMTLEVRRIEVGDRGNWTCRVWNNEGSTSRNFTLHIVDFCDYFLNVHIHPRRVPEECLCQWAIQQRDSATAPDLYHLRALPQLRADLDLSEFVQDAHRCQKYAKVEEVARLRAQPREELREEESAALTRRIQAEEAATTTTMSSSTTRTRSTANPFKNTQLTAAVNTSAVPARRKWRPTLKNLSAKIQLARKLVKGAKGRKGDDEDDEEEQEVKILKWRTTTARPTVKTITPTTTTAKPVWTVRTTRPPSWLATSTRWSLPQRVPPYFRQLDEHVQTNIVIPAGRTLRLSCKAGGQPEPQVVWRKGNEEILRDTESKTGSLYQLRRWSLELEDAAEVDSGDYVCEVFNSAGSIARRFRVEVQDRIRSRPILVPNVLVNQTVDVNGTVSFTCQVISDLVPHVIWIKLVQQPGNGSYLRWDPKEQRQTLNFIDLSTVSRTRIFHDKHTNRYTMELANVSMEDQGIYSCVAGNTLGLSMANATLTVNEFRSLTLPTEVPVTWPLSYTVLLILSFLLLCAFIALCLLYLFFSKKFASKSRIQTLDKMAVRKKVVITKKPQREGEHWSDLASSYSITVEPVPVIGGREGRQRTGTGDTVPLMGTISREGHHPNAESSLLSDYEVPTDMAWEIERERLQLVDILGEGAFGEVWSGLLKPKSEEAGAEAMPVAVKRLKAAAQERELIILVSEMQILKSIGHHPNILRLIGCCTGLGPLLVVLELCEHGNLRDFLRKHRPKDQNSADIEDEEETEETDGDGRPERPQRVMYQNVERLTHDGTLSRQLALRDLVQFATEIARGMEFLASKKIIHRDLAARNVLVSHDLSMKISDFGLSRNVFYHDYYRKRGAGRLPIKWMAPEALEANVYTVHSDVWSYGILLWEIMTLGGTPYPSIAMPQLYNLLKEGYRMEAPHNCPDEIYGVMVSCWQDRPEARPAFRTIADFFDWMLTEAEKTDTSRSETENGETTDEGPYAVIPEGSQSQEYGQQPEINGNMQKPEEGEVSKGEQRRPSQQPRPMSAPGLMSFEVFSQFAISTASEADGSSQRTPEYIRLPPRAPNRPERRSLLEQLREVVWRGDKNAAAAEPRLIELDEEASIERGHLHSTGPIYNNLQPSPQSASAALYANTARSPVDLAQPGPSSSSVESFPPAGTSSGPSSMKRPKKSIASEHERAVLFTGIAQQNAKLGGIPRGPGDTTAIGSAGSSAGFGRSPPGSSSLHAPKLGADWRSRSMDSSSSGHGGSSAMSSADALLGATAPVKEEEAGEGQDSPPVGQTVDYVTIAPIGKFPA